MSRLIKFRPVSADTYTPEAGPGSAQMVEIPIPMLGDGAGAVARRSDVIYVSDFTNHVIYKVTRGVSVLTFVGQYGIAGTADGQGTNAQFFKPGAMALDNSGTLWVVDVGNGLLRRVSENGNVYTVATIPVPPSGDEPGHITIDDAGNIFLIES